MQKLPLLLLFFCGVIFSPVCTSDSEDITKTVQEKNINIEIEDSPEVELYHITLESQSGKTEYYEKATGSSLSVSVPTENAYTLTVDLFSENIKTHTGSMEIPENSSGLFKIKVQSTSVQQSTPQIISNWSISINSGTVQLKWKSVEAADGYKIYRTTDTTSEIEKIATVQGNSILDTEVTAGITYFYYIKAFNLIGTSGRSDFKSIKIPENPIIKAPGNIKGKALNSSSIEINWDKSDGALLYKIYRINPKSMQLKEIGETDITSYTDKDLSAQSTWMYFVTAIIDSEESAQSDTIEITTDVTVPETPSGISATALSETSISIDWESVNYATSYLIRYSKFTDEDYISVETNDIKKTIKDLTPSTIYYIEIAAKNSAGESDFSEKATAKTLDPALLPPEVPILVINEVFDHEIEIIWLQIKDASLYIIEKSLTSTGSFTPVCTTASLSFTITGLSPNTRYYFRCKASNSVGESEYSATITAQTKSSILPPSEIETHVVSSSSISINWQAASGASEYVIYRGTTSSVLKSVDTVSGTNFIDSNLSSSTKYYYAISSIAEDSESEKSQIESATTKEYVLPTPTGLKATTISSTSIKIQFNAVTGAQNYKLYWCTNNTSFTLLNSVSSTSFTHTGLTANTTYYYKVTAVNGDSESEFSNAVSATTQNSSQVATINSSCTGCGDCVRACKFQAIVRNGRQYVIDPSKCSGCGDCVSRCRKRAISLQ